MELSKEVKQYVRERMVFYYETNFKDREFDLALLSALEKEVSLLKEAFIHFILLRNILIYIKRQKSKNLSDKQIKMLEQTIFGVNGTAKELLNILLPILECIGD